MTLETFLSRIVWAPTDEAGAGASGEPSGSLEQEVTETETPSAAAPEEGSAASDQSDAWWQSSSFDVDEQTQLKALGLTGDDPLNSVKSLLKMERGAKAKLGKGVDQLIEKPGEGADVGEWLRQNGSLFGVPESAEAYEISPPDGWPDDAKWNSELEAEARKIAHEEGLSGKALQRMTELYAGNIQKMMSDADTELAQASASMMSDLEKEWGDQTPAKIAQVQQVSAAIAERAGLDEAAMANIAATLKPKIGDAGTIRLFSAVADLMSDDSAAGLTLPGGSVAMTPAEARQQIEQMKADGSPYRQAMSAKNAGKGSAEFERLHKEFVALQKIAAG